VRVPGSVVEQVAHQLPQQHGRSGHLHRHQRRALDDDLAAPRTHPGDRLDHDLVEVHETLSVGLGAGQPGQQEQRGDQGLQPGALGEDVLGQLRHGDPVGVRTSHLGDLPDHRQRRAQLVGGVGDELALGPLAGVDPVEHRVERRGQPGQLVVAGGYGEPSVQVRAADLTGLAAHLLHRAQGAADAEPNDRAQSDDRDRDEDGQQAGRLRRGLVALLGGAADGDEADVAGPVGGDERERVVLARHVGGHRDTGVTAQRHGGDSGATGRDHPPLPVEQLHDDVVGPGQRGFPWWHPTLELEPDGGGVLASRVDEALVDGVREQEDHDHRTDTGDEQHEHRGGDGDPGPDGAQDPADDVHGPTCNR
jgi:hypothetical protein